MTTTLPERRPGYRLHDHIAVDLHEGGASVAEAEARLAVSDAPTAWLSARRALGLLDGDWVLADLPEAAILQRQP